MNSVSISRRNALQSDVVHKQGPIREIDRPGLVPGSTSLCRDGVVWQAGRLLIGLDGTLDTLRDPGADGDRKVMPHSLLLNERIGDVVKREA